MTLLLILGSFACLYLVGLLITCTLHALPLGSAIGTGFWLLGHGAGIGLSTLGALIAGVAVSTAGPWAFARAQSPVRSLAVMLLFAIPAGIAGHQMVHGLGRLMSVQGTALSSLSSLGGIVIAGMAGRRLPYASGRMEGPTS